MPETPSHDVQERGAGPGYLKACDWIKTAGAGLATCRAALDAASRCLQLPLLPSPPAAAATFLARPACYCLP